MAKTKKPIILSTGLSTYRDIKLALKTIRSFGNNKIIVLKCTTAYPSELKEQNLSTISDIKKKFKVLAGFSDHTKGKIASISAASIIAKVARDKFMIKLAKKYPKYCWNKNFGYGTVSHLKGLKKYGITKHHRKKFKPIHNILMKKTRETQ